MTPTLTGGRVPTHIHPAVLKVIDLHVLQNGSQAQADLLLGAAVTDGFFYLDFSHPSYRGVLDSAEAVLQLAAEIFNHHDETKRLFDVDLASPMKTNGYKPKGRNIVSKDGTRDSFESWALPRNGLLNITSEPFPHPPCVAAHTQPLGSLLQGLGAAAQTIFASLSQALSLAKRERFEGFHDPRRPSTDLLRLLKYHSTREVPLASPQTPHTDLGSLTFVFSHTPGLQVLPHTATAGAPPRESDWVYVAPRANCAVVNFGDCMTMLTGGLIKSSLHRVGPLPGMAMHERYSFAYLMRPEDDTPLRPVQSPLVRPAVAGPLEVAGETFTSREWVLQKFQALRGARGTFSQQAPESPAEDQPGFAALKFTDQVIAGGRAVMV